MTSFKKIMTCEDKELLLKDLCSRVPYNTKIQLTEYSDLTGEKLPSKIKILDYCMLGKVQAYCKGFRKDEVKPYLLPLSSMTEEQRKEFDTTLKYLPAEEIDVWTLDTYDWCNKNNFDYRGLIPKGLATDATNLNIY